MVELDHHFSTGKDTAYNWAAIRDLDRIVPCVEGGKVIERESDEKAKAEIKVKMGAMSMTFRGTVEVVERDENTKSAVLAGRSKDVGGQGYANADVRFTVNDGGGDINTKATINGKAASMGEGVVQSVLDALIKDFTNRLAKI